MSDLGRHRRQPLHLLGRGTGRVLGRKRDAGETLGQVGSGQALEIGELGGGQRLVDLGSDVEAPHEVVMKGPAVVDRGLVLVAAEERLGVVVDAVHGQVGGDAVGQLEPHPERVRLIGQQIDETGGDDQALGADLGSTGQRAVAHGGDRVSVDADVGQTVESRVRIDDPTTPDDDIEHVVLQWLRRRGLTADRQRRWQGRRGGAEPRSGRGGRSIAGRSGPEAALVGRPGRRCRRFDPAPPDAIIAFGCGTETPQRDQVHGATSERHEQISPVPRRREILRSTTHADHDGSRGSAVSR